MGAASINHKLVNPPLRMRRAGYSSRFVCLSVSQSVTVLRSQMRHFNHLNGHGYKVGDDQKDLNEADF